jgi:hypothetical protein
MLDLIAVKQLGRSGNVAGWGCVMLSRSKILSRMCVREGSGASGADHGVQ